MEAETLVQNGIRILDSQEWPEVSFGDVVTNVKENIDRDSTELNRYVAGEHMDSDNIHLSRWGDLGID